VRGGVGELPGRRMGERRSSASLPFFLTLLLGPVCEQPFFRCVSPQWAQTTPTSAVSCHKRRDLLMRGPPGGREGVSKPHAHSRAPACTRQKRSLPIPHATTNKSHVFVARLHTEPPQPPLHRSRTRSWGRCIVFLLNAGGGTGVGAPARRRGGGPTSLARPRDYPWRPQMRGLSCLASRASTALDRRSPLTHPVTHHGHAAKTSREPPLPGLPSRLFPFPVRATQLKNMAPPPRSLLALAAAAVAAGGVAAFMPPVTEDGWYQGEKPERERGLARTRA